MPVPAPLARDRPFAGEQVALLGKPAVLSRRQIRSIVERLGGMFSPAVTPRTTVLIVADDAAARVPEAGTADLPAHVRRQLTEHELCRQAGLPDLETLRARYYAARDLRGMYPVLRDDHLRYLERAGLIRPVAGRYSFTDLHVIKQAAGGLERGASLNSVLRGLASAREGQLAFDFQPARSDRQPARVVSLPAPEKPREMPLFPIGRTDQLSDANYALAAKYFLEGAQLDDGEARDLDAAASAYRRALLFDAQLVPALVNLANIHYERDELVEAEALYEKAIRLDADCFEAYFNLGNIQHDLARFADAVTAYREALAINPAYPEAHFYLAVTLEKLGRSGEARPHWKEYRQLAPDGEFVELAKEFSD